MTNYHKPSGLKLHKFIISQFCESEVWHESQRAKIKMPGGLYSLLESSTGEGSLFQAHLGCWPNSVPCGCRTEVPVSLWLLGRDPPVSLDPAHISSISSSAFPVHLQSQQGHIISFPHFLPLQQPLELYLVCHTSLTLARQISRF